MSKRTRQVSVGGVLVGGGERVKIQSMTTTKTSNVEGTVKQIGALEEAGCEIVRVAVSDEADAAAVRAVKERIRLPLVADIHFSPKLAAAAIENGADKVRIQSRKHRRGERDKIRRGLYPRPRHSRARRLQYGQYRSELFKKVRQKRGGARRKRPL